MRAKSILASFAAGGSLFAAFALLAITLDRPSSQQAVLLSATSDSNKLAGFSSLHSAKKEADDLASYFDSIPTSHVNAFHEPKVQLSLESSVTVNDEAPKHMSTRAAQNDLSTFFRAVPTAAVNAFHDPSKPPHYYSSPSHTHQKLSDTKAQRELDDYFTSLPAHNVNAYHDNAAQHAIANGLSTSKADTELSKYYDSIPAHLVKADHEPNRGQTTNHLSLRQGMASAAKGTAQEDIKSIAKSVAPVKKAAAAAAAPVAAKQGRRRDHKPYHDSKISIIQDWGADADAPTAVETARQKGAYDTQYGMQDGLTVKTMEVTPAGPVQTSFGLKPKPAPAKEPVSSKKAK